MKKWSKTMGKQWKIAALMWNQNDAKENKSKMTEIDGMETQWKNRGSDVGPLSRKARVKEWKSNGKIAVWMCDHYGVEARK